ncbi:MAG: hypothetical protein ABSH28_09775 [Acidobacteriota bacterium]
MSVPVFLNSSFYYFERKGVSDVQTIMDDFENQVLHVNVPAWSKPSAGLYKSPVDANGRWYDVLFTRITQQKLEMRLRDATGVTVCTRRINCPTANSWNVHIFTGEHHMHIDVDAVSAVVEVLFAGMLDPTPDAAHNKYVYGNGSRSTADYADSSCDVAHSFMIDNATPGYGFRTTSYGTGNYTYALLSMNGSRIYRPVGLWCRPTGENYTSRFAGRRYNSLLTESTLAWGAKVTIPIDIGLSGLFRVTGVPTAYSAKIVIRIA